VVEEPPTLYLHWELNALKVRAQAGEQCRIVLADHVVEFEPAHPLPELVIFGPHLMYEVLYNEAGRWQGGRRITDSAVIQPCLSHLTPVYLEGEELTSYFERTVATREGHLAG